MPARRRSSGLPGRLRSMLYGRPRTPDPPTPAQLTLQRLYDQVQSPTSKNDVSAEMTGPVPIKGKPRLLLMGQRR